MAARPGAVDKAKMVEAFLFECLRGEYVGLNGREESLVRAKTGL